MLMKRFLIKLYEIGAMFIVAVLEEQMPAVVHGVAVGFVVEGGDVFGFNAT